MKNISLLVLVISMAHIANGQALITVNGEISPEVVTMNLNEELNIGLWGDGSIKVAAVFLLGLAVGNEATLDISTVNILYPGIFKSVGWEYEEWITDFLNVENPCIAVLLSDPVMPPGIPRPLEGQLVEDIRLSPTNVGEITLILFDGDMSPIDSQSIDVQQTRVLVPEPVTIAMLGLGLMMLRRRR